MARLPPAETKVLHTILDLYRESAEWPQFGALHRRLAKDLDGELMDVTESLMKKLGGHSKRYEWADEIELPVRGILLDSRIEETYAVLVRALPLLKEFYLNAVEKPRVTHQYFLDRGWSASDTLRLYHLLRHHPVWSGMGATPENGTWNADLNPEIVRYAKARNAKELWQWRAEADRKLKHRRRPKNSLGHPDYRMSLRAEGSWFDRYLMPLIIGIVATVVAGAILWWIGFG